MLLSQFLTLGMVVGSFRLRPLFGESERKTFVSRMSQPCFAQVLLRYLSSPMESILSLRARWQRINAAEAPPDAEMMVREVQPERARRNWKRVMVKLFQVLESFMARDLMEDMGVPLPGPSEAWRGSGSADGSSLHSWQAVADTPSQKSLEHMSKCEQMAQEVQHGIFVGLRKCRVPPRVQMEWCSHPVASLARAGNQWQSEVWCQECYARWKVTTSSPATRSKAHPKGKSKARAAAKAMPNLEFRCRCNLPAARRVCKKESLNQGRKFFTCEMGVCDFFMWDPMETQVLREGMAVSAEDDGYTSTVPIKEIWERVEQEQQRQKVRQLEEELEEKKAELRSATQASQSSGEAMERVLQEAAQRHQQMMGQSVQTHQAEMAQMQASYVAHINELNNHIYWLKAVAGEERVQAVLSDPLLHAQSVQEAVQMRQGAEASPP